MRKSMYFTTILTAYLLLGLSGLGISAEPQGNSPGAGASQHGTYSREEILQRAAVELSVDKKTIEDMEKRSGSLENALRVIILAQNKADQLIKEGKFSQGQEKEALAEGIAYVFDRLDKQYGWGDIAYDLNIKTSRDMNKRIYRLIWGKDPNL